jgi:hypothetical protein
MDTFTNGAYLYLLSLGWKVSIRISAGVPTTLPEVFVVLHITGSQMPV